MLITFGQKFLSMTGNENTTQERTTNKEKKNELRKISVVSLSVCLSSYEQGTFNHPEKPGGHVLLSLDSENNKELCSLSLFY